MCNDSMVLINFSGKMGVSATQPQTLTKNMAHLVDLFGHILSLNRVFEILK